MHPVPAPRPRARRLPPFALLAALLLASGTLAAPAAPLVEPGVPGELQRPLAVNRLAMQFTNVGSFASDLFCPGCLGYGGLEYPRGSGKLVAFAGGLWVTGRGASDSLRAAIVEYSTDFIPGPWAVGGPGLDTTRYRVFGVARGDTAGTAAWMARAVPLGAPVDSAGTGPGLIGDQTLWAVCTDEGVTAQYGNRGPRTPIELEVQLTGYAFDRPPALQDVAFLHWRIVNKGNEVLDSAYVALFWDADMRTAETPAASDTSLDLGYVYRTTDDVLYGSAGPAAGLMLLRGPRGPGSPADLRATSIVGYPNGVDPVTYAEYDSTARGFYPWGAAMIDSTTGLPTRFYATGDPVTGTGWLMPGVIHPKVVLGAGPFHFMPGDTQVVDAAVVIGRGADRPGSVTALRANAREARDAFAANFAGLPAWQPPAPPVPAVAPLAAWPVPARGSVELAVTVPSEGAWVALDVLDVHGRVVRRFGRAWQAGGTMRATWDGRTEAGRRAPTGIYFARARVGETQARARIVLLR